MSNEIYFPEDGPEVQRTVYRSLDMRGHFLHEITPEMLKLQADIDMINNMAHEVAQMRPIKKAK